MRFWQKIFIYGYIVLFIALDAIGIIWLSRDYSSMVQRETLSALSYHKAFQQSLYTSLTYWKELLSEAPDIYKSYQSDAVSKLIQSDGGARQILLVNGDNQVVFSNSYASVQAYVGKTMDNLDRNISYRMDKVDKKMLIVTASRFQTGNNTFLLYCINDISTLYNDQNDKIKEFIWFSTAICIIAAGLLGIISYLLTRPLRKLELSARHIAKGDYSMRAKTSGHDEVAVLSSQINVMADAVNKREHELQQELNRKQRFVEYLTHELKTPLTSVIAYADLLRTVEQEPYEVDEALTYISSEGKRLEAMSNKLMLMFHLKSGELALKPAPLRLIFKQVYDTLHPSLGKKNLTLALDDTGVTINMEKDLFKTLLFNLLDNAIKASPQDSTIHLRAKEEDNRTIIEIIDHGFGIPEKDMPHVLEPFYMVDKARTRQHNGAGLGLSLCREIIALHHASMEIESREGKGTCVRIVFIQGEGQA